MALAAVMGGMAAGSAATPAAAQNFIINGGFESTATTKVPPGWTPNDGYLNGGYDGVTTNSPRSGSYDLEIGDYDADPLENLSQTFADVVGGVYTATFYAFKSSGTDSNAFLTVTAGGQGVTFTTANPAYGTYQMGTFAFTGTGSDTLTISAKTDPGDWYVDDVSVTGPALTPVTPVTPAVPEPANWAMMIVGFGLAGAAMRARGRSAKLAYA